MRCMLVSVLLGFSLLSAPQASAANFGCESVAGSVIFKDTLYGVMTGTLLSGLYILSQSKEDRDNTEQTLSSGASIGGILGFGLGVTEIAMRECPPIRLGQKAGFSGSFAAIPLPSGEWGSGVRLSWNF